MGVECLFLEHTVCCAGVLLVTLLSILFLSPPCSVPCKADLWGPHRCPLASSVWPEIGKKERGEYGLGIYSLDTSL